LATLLAAAGALASLLAPAARAEWLPPVEISASSENVARPHVALDSAGNATAVWDRWDGSATVIETAYRPAGSPWGAPQVLSPPDSMSPKIVVDRNGVLTAAWERRSSTNHFAIESVSRMPGLAWGEPIEVTEFEQGFSPESWLAVDWEGSTTLVWKQAETVMSSFRVFLHDWGEPIPLSPGESFTPQTAMDARGDATAVWMHDDGSRLVVESAYRPEQGEWEAPTLVSQPGEEGGNPQVAVDGQGDSLVVWRGEDEGGEFVRAAYRPVNGSWSEPVNVSEEGEKVHALQAAVDPEGNAIVAWAGNQGNVGEFDVAHAAFKPADGNWEAPTPISEAGANAYPNDLVFDQSGNAAVVWLRWDGVDWRIQAAYRPADGDWEAPTYLSDEGIDAMDAVIVLDAPGSADIADGDATAIWVGGTPVPCPDGDEIEPCNTYVVEAAGYDPDGLPEVEVEAPAEGEVGEEIEISTPTEGLYSPEIFFGDGEKAAGTEATHVYDQPGTYLVRAAGAEELGYLGIAEQTLKIVGEGEPEPEPEPEEKPGSGSTENPGAGSTQADPPAGTAPPMATGPTPRCLDAQAARTTAARRLRNVRAKMETSVGAKELRRLVATAQRRLAALRRARARVAAAC
jgi:hypothetical protein